MSKCPGDPCAAGLCKGRCSTGRGEPGPMSVHLRPSFHNHETSCRRSSAFGQTHYFSVIKMRDNNERKTEKACDKKKQKTFMSVPPCCLCFKALNGYVPLAWFRSDRAEIAFSPLAGGSQPSHCDNGSSLKLLYLISWEIHLFTNDRQNRPRHNYSPLKLWKTQPH